MTGYKAPKDNSLQLSRLLLDPPKVHYISSDVSISQTQPLSLINLLELVVLKLHVTYSGHSTTYSTIFFSLNSFKIGNKL